MDSGSLFSNPAVATAWLPSALIASIAIQASSQAGHGQGSRVTVRVVRRVGESSQIVREE